MNRSILAGSRRARRWMPIGRRTSRPPAKTDPTSDFQLLHPRFAKSVTVRGGHHVVEGIGNQ